MEFLGQPIQMWFTFAFILIAIIFYAMDHIPLEITSLGILCSLLLLFYFMPVTSELGENLLGLKVMLAGFADPALITILALLVIGQGMVQTGALETPAQALVKLGTQYPLAVIFLTLVVVMVISAFLNNTPVVVIFIPIMLTLADKMGRSATLVLMPLSFVAILGGMTTVIGSSTNLLVSASYEANGGEAIGFFDFSIPGLFMMGIGFLYVIFIAPKILPSENTENEKAIKLTGKQFIVQIDLAAGNSLIGKKSIAGMFPDLAGVTVRLVKHRGREYLPPFDDITLARGDALIIATTRRILAEKIGKDPSLLQGVLMTADDEDIKDEEDKKKETQQFAEVIITPASRLNGNTLERVGFLLQGGCKILGIQRRSRMIRTSIDDIRLQASDILLIVGTQQQMHALRTNKDILLMEWSMSEVPTKSAAFAALAIFFGVVCTASTGMIPIPIAATIGAFLMILSGCLNLRQASRSIDSRIFLLIGAALAMGVSLQMTGGASYLATKMLEILDGASVSVILSAFFLMVAILTNVLSNNATAVLFTPIAVQISNNLGVDPMIFVTAVIFAANCSFATPMGYQTNLLIMGPGNYKFSDFMKVGVPLIILLWVSFSIFAPLYYGL
jgi:di/tricarboxylate transporter